MGDLISREEAGKILKEYFTSLIKKGIYEIDVVDCNAELQKLIKNQVTAYDVEKVINQLSTKMFSAELHGGEWNGQTIGNLLCMGDVYEILKGGGVDEWA